MEDNVHASEPRLPLIFLHCLFYQVIYIHLSISLYNHKPRVSLSHYSDQFLSPTEHYLSHSFPLLPCRIFPCTFLYTSTPVTAPHTHLPTTTSHPQPLPQPSTPDPSQPLSQGYEEERSVRQQSRSRPGECR